MKELVVKNIIYAQKSGLKTTELVKKEMMEKVCVCVCVLDVEWIHTQAKIKYVDFKKMKRK